MNYECFIFAGFGGQGILSAGKLLAYAGMLEDKNVSWLPSYGAEMRGGTANCNVIISTNQIPSPVLFECDVLFAMNKVSLDKYEKCVKKNGYVFYDSSFIQIENKLKEIEYIGFPATKVASELKKEVFANIVLLGLLIEKTRVISKNTISKALEIVLSEKKKHLIPEEMKFLEIASLKD